ncbi:prepilin-type N-terminal cleavage/methylation domain-containing protein [Planctomycetota bacterium]
MSLQKANTGFTLLEMMIVTVILTVVILGILHASEQGQRFTTMGINTAYLNTQTERAVRVIAMELMNTNTDNIITPLQPPLGLRGTLSEMNAVDEFSIQVIEGYDDDVSEIIWSNPITYSWQPSDTDPTEGDLFRTDAVGNSTTVLRNVPLNGFQIALDGDTILLGLSSQDDIKDFGLYIASYETEVVVRN